MTATYDCIATTTLGSAASSVTFSSISGSYTDLVLVFAGSATATADFGVRVNSDSGTNYSFTHITGTGSAASSFRSSNTDYIIPGYGVLAQLTTGQSNVIVNVMNYANTTTYKTMLIRGNNAGQSVVAEVGLWRSTSAITSLSSTAIGTTFTSGSIFTLYGIKCE